MELDHIDYQILQLLSENARIQWKDLGNQIHMTGQAVGNRIKKLEDNGVIHSYSLVVDELKLGLSYTAFVIIYLQSDRRLSPQGMIGHRPMSRREMNIGRRQPICLSKNLFAPYTFTFESELKFVYNWLIEGGEQHDHPQSIQVPTLPHEGATDLDWEDHWLLPFRVQPFSVRMEPML